MGFCFFVRAVIEIGGEDRTPMSARDWLVLSHATSDVSEKKSGRNDAIDGSDDTGGGE